MAPLRNLCVTVALIAAALWVLRPSAVLAQYDAPVDASYLTGNGCIGDGNGHWTIRWLMYYNYTGPPSGNGLVPEGEDDIPGLDLPKYEDCSLTQQPDSGMCTGASPTLTATVDQGTAGWDIKWAFEGPVNYTFPQCPGQPASCAAGTYSLVYDQTSIWPLDGSTIFVKK